MTAVHNQSPWNPSAWLFLIACVWYVISCDRLDVQQQDSGQPTSVLDSQRSDAEGMDQSLQSVLKSALSGERNANLIEDLTQQSPNALLGALMVLPDMAGAEGEKGGFAAMMLGVLAEKSPSECVRYLTSRKSAYGLHRGTGGVLALRQAMQVWSAKDPGAAFTSLAKLQDDSDIKRIIDRLAESHSESLALSMAGGIPIDDMEKVHRVWAQLSRKDVGAVLSRHLAKAQTPDERATFIGETADWVNRQWRQEGSKAVFDWAIGVTDDGLRAEVLDKVELP